MGSSWGPNGGGGNNQGGWSSPGMGRGHHGGPRPHSPHGFGGYGGPGPSNDLPSRGRSLLGAPPPLMGEPPGPPHPPSPSHAPVAPPAQGPNINHLELQAAEIRQNIKTLQVKKREKFLWSSCFFWKSLFLSSDCIIEILDEQNKTFDDDSKYFRRTGLFKL